MKNMNLTGPQATVIAAVIALIGIVIGAFLNPFAANLLNQPTSTPSTSSIAIEELSPKIFTFDGRDEDLGGNARLQTKYVDNVPNYYFRYILPEDQQGYTGLAFQFDSGRNISDYLKIEFVIEFNSGGNFPYLDLVLKDIGGNSNYIRIVGNGTGEIKQSYLLNNFSGVNLSALQEIKFESGTGVSTGSYEAIIREIRFVQ